MKNNKGVTLVELLIVIVVMGIIAAFAVPSVQTIISNTRKSAAYADALAFEQAADLYCADTLCEPTVTLAWSTLQSYVEGITDANYELEDTNAFAERTDSGPWEITLEAKDTGKWEFVGDYTDNANPILTPSLTSRDASVAVDAN